VTPLSYRGLRKRRSTPSSWPHGLRKTTCNFTLFTFYACCIEPAGRRWRQGEGRRRLKWFACRSSLQWLVATQRSGEARSTLCPAIQRRVTVRIHSKAEWRLRDDTTTHVDAPSRSVSCAHASRGSRRDSCWATVWGQRRVPPGQRPSVLQWAAVVYTLLLLSDDAFQWRTIAWIPLKCASFVTAEIIYRVIVITLFILVAGVI